MDIVSVLSQSPVLFASLSLVLGLMVGSFLNVVILRLPAMLEYQWRQSCRELNGVEAATPAEPPPPGIVSPRSRCPRCRRPLSPLENLPIISYIALRGRCRGCGQSISPRYPIVEAATGLLSLAVALTLGFTAQGMTALLLTWLLIVLSVIDLDHQLLPDNLTLPGLWAGLSLSLWHIFSTPSDAIIGALVGYLSLWSLYHAFRLLTGKEGMGYGDFKLLALLGGWLGWQMLPGIILISSVVGAMVGLALIALGDRRSGQPMPFGPFLAAGGWIMLLWGPQINEGYLRLAGLS